MRVLVLWADETSTNLGVRVLADGAAHLAREAWGADTEVAFQQFTGGVAGRSLGGRTIAADIGRSGGPVKSLLGDFDVVIDTGAGDSFTDIYGQRRISTMLYTQETCRRLGVPYVMSPQTIGPFRSAVTRRLAGRMLSHAAKVFTRDSVSTTYARTLGTAPDATATDVVFCLPQPVPATPRDVVLNPSGLLWNPNPHVDHELYREHVVDIGRRLLAEGRSVTVMAHVLDSPATDNDVPTVNELTRVLGSGAQSLVPSSLGEARASLASAGLVIGSRMHACLNALSVGTPAVSLAYSRKFAPLMGDLDYPYGVDLRNSDGLVDQVMRAASDDSLAARAVAARDLGAERLRVVVDLLREVHTR